MQPIYGDLNLRTSDVLGDFVDVFPLPHIYGDLRRSKFSLGKLSSTLYYVADHPMAEISAVQISGQDTKSFASFTKADRFGIVGTYVELGSPPDQDNAIVTASGRGKLSAKTGKLIENPADIIEDIAAINGKTVQFFLLKEEASRRGFTLAGVLREIKSVRLHIKQILDSCNTVWVKDNAIFRDADLSFAQKIVTYTTPTYKISLESRAGQVKIGYNYNDAANRYGSYAQFKAKSSSYQKVKELSLRWLVSNKNAITISNYLCQYYAGTVLDVSATVQGTWSSGDVVYLDGALYPQPFIILDATPKGPDTDVKGEVILSLWDKVELLNYSAELPITQKEAIELSFDNGVLTITIYGPDNKPFTGAFVSLDNSAPKKTNSRGKVAFKTNPGGHILDISAPGFDPINNLPIDVQ